MRGEIDYANEKEKKTLELFLFWFCVDEINHRKCSFLLFFFFKIDDTRKSIHQNLEAISILYLRKWFEFEWAVCNQCNVYRFTWDKRKQKVHYHSKRNGKLNQDLPAVVVKQSRGSSEAVWDDLSCLKCILCM